MNVKEFHIGDRVFHTSHGYGDVQDVKGDEIRVYYDKARCERKALISMGSLRHSEVGEEGGPVKAPEKPPLTPIVVDDLYTQVERVLRERGTEGRVSLAQHIGVEVNSLKNWRQLRRVPADRRAEVEAWLKAPRHEIPPVEPAPLPVVEEQRGIQIAPEAMIRILTSLGLVPATCYVIKAGKLVERTAFVTPE